MPHVNIKFYPGRSEEQKAQLTQRIVEDIVTTLDVSEDDVSLAIEEVGSEEWAETVYRKEIEPALDHLYKKPGYKM